MWSLFQLVNWSRLGTDMLRFKYGTYEEYKSLQEYEPETLYFLDNHTFYKGTDLISNVYTVEEDFPNTPTEDMRLKYFISLKTGELRYVTENLEYLDLSALYVQQLEITSDLALKIKDALSPYLISVKMPNMSV